MFTLSQNITDELYLICFGAYLCVTMMGIVLVWRTHRFSHFVTPYLGLFFLIAFCHSLTKVISWTMLIEFMPWMTRLLTPFFFFAPAAIYWHCRSVITRKQFDPKSDFGWFILPILTIPYWMVILLADQETIQAVVQRKHTDGSQLTQILISVEQAYFIGFIGLYLTAYTLIVRMIRSQGKTLNEYFSSQKSIASYSLSWVLVPLGFLIFPNLLISILFPILPSFRAMIENSFYGLLVAYYELFSISVLVVMPVITTMRVLENTKPNHWMEERLEFIETTSIDKKYKKSPLNSTDIERLGKKIDDIMIRKKLYLHGSMTLATLSSESNISSHKISQVLNQGRSQSFFDYVNEWRVKEAARQLSLQDNANSTIVEIAYASGFNSKSTFNTAFKKQLNQTPSAYRRQTLSDLPLKQKATP